MGASLGALAMLHASAGTQVFDGLFLQSGSFFRRRWDSEESGFGRYQRITRFVGAVLRDTSAERPVPVTITCGSSEENRPNNRAMADSARQPGLRHRFAEIPTGTRGRVGATLSIPTWRP